MVKARYNTMFPVPRTQRKIFEMFAEIGEDGDLDPLLDRLDYAGVTPRQVYVAVLGRLPESAALSVVPRDYKPRDQLRHALASAEFQAGIRESLLSAFPEKKRLIFIHIPKCAGTDLVEVLAARYPRIGHLLSSPLWFSGGNFHLYLRNMARRLKEADAILFHGHVPLTWFLERGFHRLDDDYFTVVRHPLDIMISQVNYVIKRFRETPGFGQPDSREWADMLGLAAFDRDMPRDDQVALGLRILREPRIVTPNCLCAYLGTGTESSAIDLIGRFDIEITDVSRYGAWLKERWGADTARANTSESILTRSSLTGADRAYAEGICEQDMALYRRIMARLDAGTASSIRGLQLF